jgi:DNA-binding response OmpR family regulator
MPQSCRVLIVEGDKSKAETLSALLKDDQGSFEVIHAWSLEAGVTALCAVPVNALLLQGSCLTKGMSQVARIRAHFQSLAIIVIVSKENEEIGKEFFRAGACGYLLEQELDGTLLRDIIRFAAKRKREKKALPHQQDAKLSGSSAPGSVSGVSEREKQHR